MLTFAIQISTNIVICVTTRSERTSSVKNYKKEKRDIFVFSNVYSNDLATFVHFEFNILILEIHRLLTEPVL